MHEVIFEADTPAGKAFDIVLLIVIVVSVIVVMLDSVTEIHVRYSRLLARAEWMITILFTDRLKQCGQVFQLIQKWDGNINLIINSKSLDCGLHL